MGKKEEDKDVAADFFGEDAEWLADDTRNSLPPQNEVSDADALKVAPEVQQAVDSGDELGAPEKTGEQIPVAPPPAPPVDPSIRTATPASPSNADGWSNQVSEAPKDLSGLAQAPTLVFSSVPTLPPQPSPARKVSTPTPSERILVPPSGTEVAIDHSPAADEPPPDAPADPSAAPPIGELPPPTMEVETPLEPADAADAETVEIDKQQVGHGDLTEIAKAPEPPVTESDAVYGDAFSDDEQAPLVRTSDPSPARVQTPPPAMERSAEPPAPAPAPRLRYTPRGTEEGWRDAATTLVGAAAYADASGKGRLLFEAGHIYHRRVDDLDGAEAMYRDAVAAGVTDPRLHHAYAELLGHHGRREEQVTALLGLADASNGGARVDALIEASLLLSRGLGRSGDALPLLRQAAEEDPNDYISRALLRALYPSLDLATVSVEERMTSLDELASLAEGGIAADVRVERSILGEKLAAEGHREAHSLARDDLQSALDAEPGHTIAFLRLERLLGSDTAALADLYRAEAARDEQPDPGWWSFKEGVARQAAGDGERAQEAFDAAVADGYLFAERERQAAWTRTGAHSELARSLAFERGLDTDDETKAFAAFRHGWILETALGDADGALDAYREACRLDPHAAPAADGVSRLLSAGHDRDGLESFWSERRANATSDAEKTACGLRLAEVAETAGDMEAAEAGYRDLLTAEVIPSVLDVATAGLWRALQSQEDWEGLQQMLEDAAARTPDPRMRVHWLNAAATIGPAVGDVARRRALLESCLSLVPDEPTALAALGPILDGEHAYAELADFLKVAGTACTDPTRRASLLYRAARVLVDRVGDASAARPCLESALAADPELMPARWLLREACGVAEPRAIGTMYRQQATEATDPAAQAWLRVAAAYVSGPQDPMARQDLNQVLQTRPDHPGALAALESRCLVEGDHEGLIKAYLSSLVGTPDAPHGLLALRVADLLAAQGRREEATQVLEDLASWNVEKRPLRASARLACTLGAWDLAGRLLAPLPSAEDRLERARVLSHAGDLDGARALYDQLLDEGYEPVAVGSRASTVAQRAQDREAMVRAYEQIARNATAAPLRAAYGAWSAMQYDGMGQTGHAQDMWSIALDVRPDSANAFRGVARGDVATGSVEALGELFGDRPERRREWADFLLAMGDGRAAAKVLADELDGLVDGGPEQTTSVAQLLPVLVLLEHTHEMGHDWQGVYDALTLRREYTEDPTHVHEIDAKRRWLLAEKLAGTDVAWEQYKQLHDELPDDREVTEALARIAGARGETGLAIGYLRELADTAAGPDEAARYQIRVGEVYEANDDPQAAQQAYLDALDHVTDHREALDGLKRLATADEDWPRLVSVLQREANLSSGEHLLAVRREIATVTEERLGDAAVAMDAWRDVLDVNVGDREGLEHLVALSEAKEEWGPFVEAAGSLAPQLDEPERIALWRRMGIVCQEELGRDDAIDFFEKAVAGPSPDAESARRLEAIFRGRADWAAAVRALHLQAHADVDEATRVQALLDAARLELESRHDKEAAAAFYNQALSIKPDHEEALRFMASHLFEAGRFDEALPICERLEPSVEKGQDLDDFDTRMELASFYFYMAEMLKLQLEDERAIPRYERALELNPTHLATLQAVGPLYMESEAWSKAERVYRQLLQLSGGQGDREQVASTYTNLGLVERRLERSDKAYKRFNKALEFHPNHVGALKGMALVQEDRGAWSDLLNVYNQIICHATEPEDVKAAYMTKGRILDDQMQRQDKAAQHYQRSLDFDANQPVAYLRLSELAMRRDAYQEASHLAERGVAALLVDDEVDVRPLLLLVKACALQDAGHAGDAERLLAEAVAGDDSLSGELGDTPLADLDSVRQVLKARLP